MADVPNWHAKGRWFDVCKCNVPCPCSWAEPPDDDWCEGILVWHIDEGRYGDTALDDLNVLAFGSFKGNVWDKPTEPKFGMLLDDRADDSQKMALQMVFGGQAGGWPANFVALMGPETEMRGIEFAPITVEIADDSSSWSAEVSGRAKAAANALLGPTSDGKFPRVENLPGAETGPGQVATWGKATADKADALGFSWDRTGKSSKLITFDWSGPN
jgi:hypothetical protein